jgi:hypothetical protein
MKKDYSVYKFYKGEAENPFSGLKYSEENDAKFVIWIYEEWFEHQWKKMDAASWRQWFAVANRHHEFMKLLRPTDYDRPTDKAGVFQLFMNVLLSERIPQYKKIYSSL